MGMLSSLQWRGTVAWGYDMTEMLPARWGRPTPRAKFHIFREAHSLCGGWLLLSWRDGDVVFAEDKVGKEDCQACWKKYITRQG